MLTEKRYAEILARLNARGTVTIRELQDELGISESTARRDLSALAEMGRLQKVYGGATALQEKEEPLLTDVALNDKLAINYREKEKIAVYAASLVRPDDFVFIDAGSTTQLLCEKITEVRATYVTNSLNHAAILAAKGCVAILLGGRLKKITQALVGGETITSLEKYSFTLGFFGTNGVDDRRGFTTPEVEEAAVKKLAMEHCMRKFVLADSTKFSLRAAVSFGALEDATVITEKISQSKYTRFKNITEVVQE